MIHTRLCTFKVHNILKYNKIIDKTDNTYSFHPIDIYIYPSTGFKLLPIKKKNCNVLKYFKVFHRSSLD